MPELNKPLLEMTADVILQNRDRPTGRRRLHTLKKTCTPKEKVVMFITMTAHTPACVAGFIVSIVARGRHDLVRRKGLTLDRLKRYMQPDEIEWAAGELAGFDDEQCVAMFSAAPFKQFSTQSKHDVTAEVAARTIRNLIKTGIIDWDSAAFEEGTLKRLRKEH